MSVKIGAIKLPKSVICEENLHHAHHLLGLYGDDLEEQVLYTILLAINLGLLEEAFKELEAHYKDHLILVPAEARGKTQTQSGYNPTYELLHRLNGQLVALKADQLAA